MDFKLTQLGSLADEAEKARGDFQRAVWQATQQSGVSLLTALRADVTASGIRRAPAMAKTWRQVMRPTAPDASLKFAAIVFNRSRVFSRYLARGGVIAAKGGALLIPIGRAAKFKLPIGQPRAKLVKFVQAAFGPLEFGVLKDGTPALGVKKRVGKKEKFEPLFLLRKSVVARKRLDPDGVYKRFSAGADQRWFAELTAAFARLQGDPTAPSAAQGSFETRQDRAQAPRLAAITGFSVSAGSGRGLGGGL